MAKKSLEEKVSGAKKPKSDSVDDSAYYLLPKDDKDIREGTLEKVKANGKKKGQTYESDAERMMRAETHSGSIRNEVYKERRKDQDKYRKALAASRGKIPPRKEVDLGDLDMLGSVAGKAIYQQVMSEAGGPSWSDNIAEADYHALMQDKAARKKRMFREYKKGSPKSAIKEALNVASNILYNMVPFRGKFNNSRTVNYVRNTPGKHNLVFMNKGESLSDGAKARQGSDFRKQDYHPYLVDGLDDMKKFFEQVGKKPSDFGDIVYLGHGRGANAVRSDSNDPGIKKYGVKRAYQVAPIITGEDKGAIKKLADLFSPEDEKGNGKKSVLHYNEKPIIDNYVISGMYDKVSTQDISIDPHAKKHYTLKDGSATHFGTAGTNRKVNADLISLIKYHANEKKDTKAFLMNKAADGYEKRKAA